MAGGVRQINPASRSRARATFDGRADEFDMPDLEDVLAGLDADLTAPDAKTARRPVLGNRCPTCGRYRRKSRQVAAR